jgi:hypothetical protein
LLLFLRHGLGFADPGYCDDAMFWLAGFLPGMARPACSTRRRAMPPLPP